MIVIIADCSALVSMVKQTHDISHCKKVVHIVNLFTKQGTMEENNQIVNLHHLLDYDARKFTSAEVHLKNSLQNWVVSAGSIKLKTVLQKYIDLVQDHIQKMDDFFEEEDIGLISFSNRVMQALIEETEEKMALCKEIKIKDACLLASVQAINHYKISTYGTAAAFAKALDMEKQSMVFREIEINEKQIDDRLSQLAEFEINLRAKTTLSLN